MEQHTDLHRRIERLCAAARTSPTPEVVAEMNDVLSEGYAQALHDERCALALEERISEMLVATERSPELGDVALQRRATAHAAERLREHLAVMHEQFVLLGGGG